MVYEATYHAKLLKSKIINIFAKLLEYFLLLNVWQIFGFFEYCKSLNKHLLID